MALPVAAAIVTMASLNGMTSLDEGSKGWIFFSAGLIFPFLNLSSSVIVARFWSSRRAHLTANEEESGTPSGVAEDPAKTQPVKTLLIVAVGLAADICFSTFLIFSEGSRSERLLIRIFAFLLAIGYIFTTAYFFRSGIQVLRSLSSSNKPLKTMATYLLMVAGFTLMIIVSFVIVGTSVNFASVGGYFLSTALFYAGNYGASLCHLFIFTAKKESDNSTGGGGDETFLETENRRLAERYRDQNEAIARLEAENDVSAKRSELEQQLLRASELQTATEKSAKLGLQREKSSFMAALHEVRNPLNGIALTLEYIDESLSAQIGGKELEEELRTIKTCAGHQTLLLKSIMDLDKIMVGNQELPREEFNPATVCREALAMNKHSAKPGVSISLSAATEADFNFIGAPTQLNLVLVNLMSNALKFTKEGEVVLSVAVVDDAGAEGDPKEDREVTSTLRFAVTDTGPGVPREQQKKIFGMRGQAGNETSKAKGFGFGLFVAHEIVERMGGKIKLLSPVVAAAAASGGEGGGGSEFSFEIRVDNNASPLTSTTSSRATGDRLKQRLRREILLESTGQATEATVEEEMKEAEEMFSEVLTMKGWRVLTADDSELNLRLLSRKFTAGPFKKLGWQVETATTGEQALGMIGEARCGDGERRRFDLVVFDENMQPDGLLLGTEATRILRGEDERVLIVGCTGNFTTDDKKRSKESGQDLFWSKPAPPSKDALEDLVGALVTRRRVTWKKAKEEGRTEGEGGQEELAQRLPRTEGGTQGVGRGGGGDEVEDGEGQGEGKKRTGKWKNGGHKTYCTSSP